MIIVTRTEYVGNICSLLHLTCANTHKLGIKVAVLPSGSSGNLYFGTVQHLLKTVQITIPFYNPHVCLSTSTALNNYLSKYWYYYEVYGIIEKNTRSILICHLQPHL